MESKYTPGPWEIDAGPAGTLIQAVASNAEAAYLARVETWYDVAEGDANARLMAAAPDLLAALRSTLAYAEAYYRTLPDDGPEQDHMMTNVIEPARRALAKAEGGAA